MNWFGPSKDEVWRQLSEQIGAEFVDGGFWKGNKVQVHVKPWTINLDRGLSGEEEWARSHEYVLPSSSTRRAFGSRSTGRTSSVDLGKLMGMQDIEVGDPEFDEVFDHQGERRGEGP